MTPNDFNRFRGRLNPASGFQSFQFRLLEFRLGCKDEAYLRFHQNNDHNHAQLTEALRAPTLYDAFFHCLASLGHNVPKDVLERDVSKSYEAHTGVEELFLSIYRDPQSHYELYLTLEAMMDLDQNFGLWRSRHVSMVERMIGSKRGTGGSTGVKYLSQTLSKRFFPEIWSLRNHLSDGCY